MLLPQLSWTSECGNSIPSHSSRMVRLRLGLTQHWFHRFYPRIAGDLRCSLQSPGPWKTKSFLSSTTLSSSLVFVSQTGFISCLSPAIVGFVPDGFRKRIGYAKKHYLPPWPKQLIRYPLARCYCHEVCSMYPISKQTQPIQHTSIDVSLCYEMTLTCPKAMLSCQPYTNVSTPYCVPAYIYVDPHRVL